MRSIFARTTIAAAAMLALAACSSSSSGGGTSASAGTSSATTTSSSAAPSTPATSSAGTGSAAAGTIKSGLKIAIIPKQVNNPYFDAAFVGAKKACTEIAATCTQIGPTQATGAAQVQFINTAIQQGYNALVVSAADADSVVPALKKAQDAGLSVVTYDADVNDTSARSAMITPTTPAQIGQYQVKWIADAIGQGGGEIAILSAAATAANQNAWIKFMKQELKLPKYKNMKLVKIYYGNDDPKDSLQATESMLQAYPNLKGIESPTTVGISSAAQYLSNSKYKGKVVLQGLGLPSQMKKYVLNGTLKDFALWNPEDLGYLAGYAAAAIASGDIKGKVGETFTAGKLGKYKIIKGAGGPEVILGPPFLFNKKNVAKFNF